MSEREKAKAKKAAINAIVCNNNGTVRRHGFSKGWARNTTEEYWAVLMIATNVLEAFIDDGWDINEPLSPSTPSMIMYAPSHNPSLWSLNANCRTDMHSVKLLTRSGSSIAVQM